MWHSCAINLIKNIYILYVCYLQQVHTGRPGGNIWPLRVCEEHWNSPVFFFLKVDQVFSSDFQPVLWKHLVFFSSVLGWWTTSTCSNICETLQLESVNSMNSSCDGHQPQTQSNPAKLHSAFTIKSSNLGNNASGLNWFESRWPHVNMVKAWCSGRWARRKCWSTCNIN